MSHLVEVAFKGNRRDFFRWDGAEPPRRGSPVIVEGDRGEDLGRVHATGELALKRYAGVAHGALTFGPLAAPPPADDGAGAAPALAGDGVGPQRRVLRAAAAADEARAAELPALDDVARRESAERVRAHALVMKVTDAEWQWDRRKLTLYFTAEKRVDFRALVRDLAAHFRARIELKQIGVRDEAKRLSGVGRCGREYCSAAWLPELRPVNLNVAKDQHLSLNPTQISGACGRLMCSLRYEHDFYVQQRKRFPKEGRVLATARGEEKVLGNDIFRERVTLRGLDGEVRVLALAELRAELEGGAEAAPPDPRPAAGALADEAPMAAAEAAPMEAAPMEPAPMEPAPAEAAPVEAAPAVAGPVDASAPFVGDGQEVVPAVTALVDTALVDTALVDTALVDTAPADTATDDAATDDAATDDAAAEDERDDDDGRDDDPADAGAAAESGDDPAARPRRRRGRRGGRRNRGRPDGGAPPDPAGA